MLTVELVNVSEEIRREEIGGPLTLPSPLRGEGLGDS
jgi:hypothetical protein